MSFSISRCAARRALPSSLALLLASPFSLALAALAVASAPQASAQGATPEPEAEPELERGLKLDTPAAFQGYTLFSPLLSGKIYLIDMQGQVVHEWDTGQQPGGAVYLQDSGSLIRCAIQPNNPRFKGGGIGGLVQEIGWDGERLWEYELANEQQTQHHDLEVLPNGNVLLIAWEYSSRAEVLQWGRDPQATSADGLWTLALLEVEPVRPRGGEVVWEWHAWDHLVQDFDARRDGHGDVTRQAGRIDINGDHRDQPPLTAEELAKQKEVEQQMRGLGYLGGDEEEDDEAGDKSKAGEHGADWLHTNGVDYNAEYDLLVVNSPHLGEFWVIDHSTTTEEAAADYGGRFDRGGELLYRWGNPRLYGQGQNADKHLFYQHDPEWLAGATPGELRLLIFNNGGGRPGPEYSSVEELVLPFDPQRGFLREPGTAFGPKEPIWSYSDVGHFFSSFISGAQRLPNGDTLICSGADGRIFEVTPAKEIVWEYLNPFGGDIQASSNGGNAPPLALFRATRIAPDHPGLAGRLQK